MAYFLALLVVSPPPLSQSQASKLSSTPQLPLHSYSCCCSLQFLWRLAKGDQMQLLLSAATQATILYYDGVLLSTRLSLRIETSMWSQKSDPQPLSLIDWLQKQVNNDFFGAFLLLNCRTFYLNFPLRFGVLEPEIPTFWCSVLMVWIVVFQPIKTCNYLHLNLF